MLRAGRLGFDSQHRKILSLLHSVQTGSEAHPFSYPVGTGGSFPVVKRKELTTDLHLVSRSRKVELYLHSRICLHGIMLN
jgi:hypothetical protein